MNEQQVRAQVKAAAYTAAVELGYVKAINLLQEAAMELKNEEWRNPRTGRSS